MCTVAEFLSIGCTRVTQSCKSMATCELTS